MQPLITYVHSQINAESDKPGDWKWWLLISKAVKRDNNQALHLSGIFLNVNELKQKEVELKDLSATLIKRNKELQQFAYITSHNLRLPIANLLSLSRLFKNDELAPHNIIYLKKIQECISILNETLNNVNEIISYRTVDAEKMGHIYFENELQTAIASISEQINTTKTSITSNFSGKEIWFSKRMISRNFQNPITNAIKYRPKGVNAVLHINSREEKDSYTITVEDNGRGIDLDQYGDKVFKLFLRFHTDNDGKGMGFTLLKHNLKHLIRKSH